MSISPLETSQKQPKPEQESKEILLDKALSRALGRGLEQKFHEGGTATIFSTLKSLAAHDEHKEDAMMMHSEWNLLHETIENLQTSRETRLAQELSGQWTFRFSQEKEPKGKAVANESIAIDKDLSVKIMDAIDHVLRNKSAILIGFSDSIGHISKDGSVKEKVKLISKHTWNIHNVITSSIRAGKEINLLTDDKGKTTISCPSQKPITLHS